MPIKDKRKKDTAGNGHPNLSRVEEYLPYVGKTALEIFRTRPLNGVFDYQDLCVVGAIGLIEADSRYDPSFGVSFGYYIRRRVRGAILEEYRKIFGRASTAPTGRSSAKHGRNGVEFGHEHISLDSPFNSSGSKEDDRVLADVLEDTSLPDASDAVNSLDVVRVVRKLWLELPTEDQNILNMYYIRGLTMKQIGVQMGSSESWISMRMTEIRNKLREMLTAIGVTSASG